MPILDPSGSTTTTATEEPLMFEQTLTATSASGFDTLDTHHYWGTPSYTTIDFTEV